ncbi:MAG: NUDIX domain-containing protein [Bacteriovoracaceae bacterium]|nr:NUDIX domain-containing protein [Bacteriovoracaceae bacterium]
MDFHRIKQLVQTQHTLQDHEWKGAVVFLCNDRHVFFIKRSEKMPTHGGQTAFIGGHRQSGETDPWIVAQREFQEETSLSSDHLEFLGYLPIVMTARLQPIVPVMSRLLITTDEFLKQVRSNGEWDDVIIYPWSELIQEDNWEFAWRNGFTKVPVLYHPIRSGTFLTLTQNFQTHLLWGATASMVWDFLRLYYGPKAGSY